MAGQPAISLFLSSCRCRDFRKTSWPSPDRSRSSLQPQPDHGKPSRSASILASALEDHSISVRRPFWASLVQWGLRAELDCMFSLRLAPIRVSAVEVIFVPRALTGFAGSLASQKIGPACSPGRVICRQLRVVAQAADDGLYALLKIRLHNAYLCIRLSSFPCHFAGARKTIVEGK